MTPTLLESFTPYVMTLALEYVIFMGWTLWCARFSRVMLIDSDAHVDHVLRGVSHNQRVDLLRRGWVLRPEWLRLWRESTSAARGETQATPGLVQVTRRRSALNQSFPFDPTLTMKNSDGQDIRFLDSALSEDYLVKPGEFCRPGMLPPCELEIRAMCWEILLLNTNMMQLTVADQIWNRSECRSHIAGLHKAVDELRDAVRRSPEDQAAFFRVLSDWRDNEMHIPERFFKSFMDILNLMQHTGKVHQGVTQ